MKPQRALILVLALASWSANPAWAQETAPEPIPEDVPAPHPEPRVIVTVAKVRGPHDRKAVETAARKGWGGIVRCYKQTKHGAKPLRGTVQVRVEIRANGEIMGSRRQGGTLKGELARCLVRSIRKLSMPRARSGSTAEVVIKVAPGDAP
jgi:hypothetical protein